MTWDHGGKTRQQRGYGKEHERIRADMMRTVILCEECKRADPPRTRLGKVADHIRPLAHGGSGDRSNYQLLCKPCAAEKDARDRGHEPRPTLSIKYPRRKISTADWMSGE